MHFLFLLLHLCSAAVDDAPRPSLHRPAARTMGFGHVNLPDKSPHGALPSTFTGVAQVRQKGKDVLFEAQGQANKFFDVPMPVDALFRIGSNSKLFVTVALYQLQEQGVLKISDPVSDHLTAADFQRMGHNDTTVWCPKLHDDPTSPCLSPTIEQLLSMQSGLVDVTNCDYPAGSSLLDYCWLDMKGGFREKGLQLVDGIYGGQMDKLVGNFILNPLASKPGSDYHYTNANFVLATFLVEKYVLKGLGEYLNEHVLAPLRLAHTHLDNLGPQFSVSKYMKLPGEYLDLYDSTTAEYLDSSSTALEFAPGSVSGAGGMFSTSEDMVEWYRMLFTGEASDASVREERVERERAERVRVRQTILSLESIKEIVRPRVEVLPGSGVFFAQGVVVELYDETTGWPAILFYEGGTFNCFTAIAYAPPPVDLAITAFSTVSNVNVTSAAAYRALDKRRSGSWTQLLDEIALGKDDGGAGALRDALLAEYYPTDLTNENFVSEQL